MPFPFMIDILERDEFAFCIKIGDYILHGQGPSYRDNNHFLGHVYADKKGSFSYIHMAGAPNNFNLFTT